MYINHIKILYLSKLKLVLGSFLTFAVTTSLVVDSYGAWGKEASTFFERVAARLAIHKSLPKSQASFELFSTHSPKSVEPYLCVFDVNVLCINTYEKIIYHYNYN